MAHLIPFAALPFLQAGPGPAIRAWLARLLSGLVPEGMIDLLVNLVMWVVIATVIILVVQIAMLYSTWLERKFIGRIQDRIGPNRVGKFGLLQPFADMVKMLTKEDITPTPSHRWVYNLGAIMVVPPALLVFAVVPAGIGLIATDLSVGFLFFIAVASTAVIPIFMAGWGSRNKYALLGAMRAVAQIVSYEIPQVLSVAGVLLLAGTMSMQGLTVNQGPLDMTNAAAANYPGVWFVLLQPIAFFIFLIATTAEIERTPFDVPEAESEIIAGYHTEYAGIKFGMFYLALYFQTISASALAVVLFLGGWQPPLAVLGFVPGWIWFSLKTFAMVLVFMWLRGTLPRLRVDQLMSFSWKILVPVALVNLMVTGFVTNYTFNAHSSPIMVFAAFAVANAAILALTLFLAARLQAQQQARAIHFDAPTSVAEGPA